MLVYPKNIEVSMKKSMAFHFVGYSCALVVFTSGWSAAFAASYKLSPDGNTVVRLDPTVSISNSTFNASLITSAYPGWTVNNATSATGSTLSTSLYEAAWSSATLGGANLNAKYSQSNAVPAGSSLNWVQVVTTNTPLPGRSSPSLDPSPTYGDPLYWPDELLPANLASTQKTVNFTDGPTRSSSSLTSKPAVTWGASLYPVEYDGAKSVIVHDGISWGWNMKPATIGNASGSFLNPSPTCPPATCTGLGGNSVTWGTGEPGSLTFSGVAFAPKVGDVFKLGTLTYHNGATNVNSPIDKIDLDIAMSFTNISEENFSYHSTLGIINTPNTTDPAASADYVAFTTGGFPASFRVLEGATASADIMAKLTPILDVTPAASPSVEGDRTESFSSVSGAEGFNLTLVSFANPTVGGFIGPIPEPSTYALMGAGGLLLMFIIRRRKATYF
jgi:hypothetical protein